MAIGTQNKARTSEKLHKGYSMVESEYGGFYFEVGDYASEDYPSRRQAAIAAKEHRKQQLTKAA